MTTIEALEEMQEAAHSALMLGDIETFTDLSRIMEVSRGKKI